MPDTRIPVTPEQARELVEAAGCDRSPIGKRNVEADIVYADANRLSLWIDIAPRRCGLFCSGIPGPFRICGLYPARARKYLEGMKGDNTDGA